MKPAKGFGFHRNHRSEQSKRKGLWFRFQLAAFKRPECSTYLESYMGRYDQLKHARAASLGFCKSRLSQYCHETKSLGRRQYYVSLPVLKSLLLYKAKCSYFFMDCGYASVHILIMPFGDYTLMMASTQINAKAQ